MGPRSEFPRHCRCCGLELIGPWCHACGQGHAHGRLGLRELLAEVSESVLNLDGRVFRTVWGLTTRPGELVRDYLAGRRVPYVHPVKYAVGVVALYLLWVVALKWLRGAPIDAGDPTNDVQFMQPMMLGAIPVFALLCRLMFARAAEPVAVDGEPASDRFRSIEHLVFGLYAFPHVLVLLALLLPLLTPLQPRATGITLLVVYTGYLCAAAVGTYRCSWAATIPRMLVVMALLLVSFVAGLWLVTVGGSWLS